MSVTIENAGYASDDCPVKVSVGEMVVPNAPATPVDPTNMQLGDTKKKRGRKKKDSSEVEVIPGPNQSYLESNVPYHESYAETDNILRSAIGQLDMVTAQMNEDIAALRASKTIRNKYSYLSDMTGSMVSAISAKVGAAKELNNTIKNAHELDLKRSKEMKALSQEQDDEKDVLNLYKAFISQPVSQNMTGPFTNPLGASTFDLTTGAIPGMNSGMQIAMMGQDENAIYNNYVNNMTPSQMTMMIEENPDMRHVIAYDQVTGDADFAIYDQRTGQFVQGVPTRDKNMYMNGVTFDFNNMQAHSDDLNESYDIIFVNNPAVVPPTQNNSGNGDMGQY